MNIEKNTLKTSESQFKTYFNDWLKINTYPPFNFDKNAQELSGFPDIKALSCALDNEKTVICDFFKLRDDNGYDKQTVQKIIRSFLSSYIKNECNVLWAAAIPLYNQYISGGFSFKKSANGNLICKNIFCTDPQQANTGDFWKKFSIPQGISIFDRFADIFISPETSFKEYVEEYYEKSQTLPDFDDFDEDFQNRIIFHGSYYNILQACNIADTYEKSLKDLCREATQKIADRPAGNIKNAIPKYFTEKQYNDFKNFNNVSESENIPDSDTTLSPENKLENLCKKYGFEDYNQLNLNNWFVYQTTEYYCSEHISIKSFLEEYPSKEWIKEKIINSWDLCVVEMNDYWARELNSIVQRENLADNYESVHPVLTFKDEFITILCEKRKKEKSTDRIRITQKLIKDDVRKKIVTTPYTVKELFDNYSEVFKYSKGLFLKMLCENIASSISESFWQKLQQKKREYGFTELRCLSQKYESWIDHLNDLRKDKFKDICKKMITNNEKKEIINQNYTVEEFLNLDICKNTQYIFIEDIIEDWNNCIVGALDSKLKSFIKEKGFNDKSEIQLKRSIQKPNGDKYCYTLADICLQKADMDNLYNNFDEITVPDFAENEGFERIIDFIDDLKANIEEKVNSNSPDIITVTAFKSHFFENQSHQSGTEPYKTLRQYAGDISVRSLRAFLKDLPLCIVQEKLKHKIDKKTDKKINYILRAVLGEKEYSAKATPLFKIPQGCTPEKIYTAFDGRKNMTREELISFFKKEFKLSDDTSDFKYDQIIEFFCLDGKGLLPNDNGTYECNSEQLTIRIQNEQRAKNFKDPFTIADFEDCSNSHFTRYNVYCCGKDGVIGYYCHESKFEPHFNYLKDNDMLKGLDSEISQILNNESSKSTKDIWDNYPDKWSPYFSECEKCPDWGKNYHYFTNFIRYCQRQTADLFTFPICVTGEAYTFGTERQTNEVRVLNVFNENNGETCVEAISSTLNMTQSSVYGILLTLIQKRKIFNLGNGFYMAEAKFKEKYSDIGKIVNDWCNTNIQPNQLVHCSYIAAVQDEKYEKYNSKIWSSIIKCFATDFENQNDFFYQNDLPQEFKDIKSIGDAIDLCNKKPDEQSTVDYAKDCFQELTEKGILIRQDSIYRILLQ